MKYSFDISQLMRNVYARRSDPEMIQRSVHAIWATAISVMLVVSFASIAFGGWLLMHTMDAIDTATAGTRGPQSSQATLDMTALQHTIDALSAEKERFSALKTTRTPFADPSR